MKKKTSHTFVYLILCAFFAIPIICTMLSGNELRLGDVTVFFSSMPDNPPEGVSISIGKNRSRSIKYKTWYSEIDSTRQSHSDTIPFLAKLFRCSKESPQLQKLTNCKWDTLYIVKPHCTFESQGMAHVSRELGEKIGMEGPEDDTCVLVFWSEGKIVQYATIKNEDIDFTDAPNIITHSISHHSNLFALGPLCISRHKITHIYQ